MPPVIIDANISVVIIWETAGQGQALNALNAQVGGAATVNQSMANQIATHAAAAHTSSGLAAVQPDTVALAQIQIRDLRTPNQALITSTSGLPSAGTVVGGDMLPKQDALVVTKRTALSGPSFRGRAFVPGFEEDASMVAGEASQAARDAAVQFFEDWNASMTAEGWPLTVGSTESEGVPRDPGIGTLITAFESRNSSFGVQRSRRLFR